MKIMSSLKRKLSSFSHRSFLWMITFILLLISISTNAATRYSVATGNWNATSTWSTTSGGSSGASVPGSGDDVVIERGYTVTVTASTSCNSLTFNTTTTGSLGTLTINTSCVLSVSGAIQLNNAANANVTASISGAGSLSCASIALGNSTAPTSNNTSRTHELVMSIAQLTVSGGLTINSYFANNSRVRNGLFTHSSGTITIGGNITTSNANSLNTSSYVMSGSSSVLNLGAASPFNLSGTGTNTITLNNTGTVVNYNGTAQTIAGLSYYNLILSGSGAKTLQSGMTIANDLTLSGTASTSTVAALTIGNNLNIGDGTIFTAAGYNLSVTGATTVGGGASGTLNITGTAGTKTFAGLATVNSSGIINNGVAETLTFNGGLAVDGQVINYGTLNGTGAFAFNSGSIYQHARDGGTIPTATWDVNSTCLVTGITSTVPSGLSQSFGNFTWNCANQTGNLYLASNMTTQGNYTILSTGSTNDPNNYSLRMSNTNTGYTINVGGNFVVSNTAAFKMNNSTKACTLNITGNLVINNNAFFCIVTGNANSVVNVSGNLNMSGGTLCLSEEATYGILNIAGDFTQTGGAINSPVASGNINFKGSSIQKYSKTAGTISNTVNFAINSGSTVDFGTYVIDGSNGSFTLNSGGSIITANTGGLTTSGATGSIQVTGARSYSSGANYTYNGTSAQVAGNGLTGAKNLTITNPAGVTLSSNVTVSGNLSILTSGTTLNCDQYQITGNATGTMTMDPGTTLVIGRNAEWYTPDFPTNFTKAHISLDPTSTVIYYGGYRNFSSSPNYGNLVIACNSGQSCDATGNLVINGDLAINAGSSLRLAWSGLNTMTIGGQLINNGRLEYGNISGNGQIVTVAGNLSGSGTITMTSANLSPHTLNLNGQNNSIGALTTDGNNSVVNYGYTGAGTQQVFASPNYQSLTISGGGTKTLQGSATVNNTLTLTSGVLTTTTNNLLTITNTATTAITGGSASSYINGPVKWSVTPGSTYNFPIGSSSAYLPFSLVPTATTTAQIQAYSMSSGGSADGSTVVNISSTEYWSMITGSSVSGSSISASRPLAITPLNTLAAASSSNGSYSNIGGIPDTYSVSNATYTGSGTTAYFVMALAKGSSIWLKADAGTGTTTDGSPVGTWLDQSAGANDASAQNTAPLYKARGWNFNPGINFPSGGNGYFLSAKNNITNDMTFVVVYNSTQNKTGSAWADPTLIGCETSSVNNDYYLSTDNGKPFFKGTNVDQTSPIATNSYNDNLPHIVSVTRKKSIAGNIYLYVDGSAPVSGASDNTILNAPQKIGIGNHNNAVTSAQFEGGISEVYGTNSVLPITNLQNFESYLALKYGITIAHDYTNGSGTTIYSVSDHKNNIAGLGSENTSTGGYGLNQQISASSNLPLGTASRIVMTTSGNFTDANSAKPQVLANGQYLIWGDDNGSISSWTTKGAYSTVTRTWKVQNTSVTVPLNFQIDLNSSSFPTSDSGLYTLLVSTDGSFSSSTTTEYLLTLQAGSLYSTSGITFPNGTCYFSIGHPVYSAAVYVRAAGKGNQTGTSWSNAMSTIQKAVETSNKLTTKLPVYVAAGTYSNDANYTYTYNGRSVNFLMYNGVSVYGGFTEDGSTNNSYAGMSTRLTGGASILNGTYSQIIAPNATSFATSTIWDGFTITGAPAYTGDYAVTIPGGAVLQNSKIRLNSSGGLNLLTGAASYNVLVADNGAAGVALAGTAKLINATVVNNTGAGIASSATTPTISNSILWNNNGGGDNITGTIPLTTNITYTASGASAAFTSNTTGTTGLTNSWASGTGNIELYHRSPNFKDAANTTKANRNYELLMISPCLDANNAAVNPLTIDANGKPRTNSGKIDMGAFQKWDGYSTNGTNINAFRSASTYTPSTFASTIATSANQANVELLVPSGITLNIGSTPFYTNYLEIEDLSTTSPIIKGGTLNATKALYVRKFTKLRTSGAQAWTFFGVPYDVNVNQIDGGIAENTVRIEQYNENTRALNGANKSAWKPYLTTASTMNKGTGYALQFNNKVPDSAPYVGNTVIFPSKTNITFTDPDAPVTKSLSYTPSGVSWFDIGWNFISNPFPQIATIEYSTSNYWPMDNSGTIDPSVNAYGGGVYTYDTDGDTYDIIPLISFYSRGLAPYAGCFIKNGANIGNIQFKQLASSPNPLKVKSFSDVEQVTSDIAKPMLFHLHASGNNKSGNTYVLFHPNAHAAQVEIEDSPNWSATSNGSNIVMNTFAEGSSLGLGINMLPFTGNSIEIPLQISVPDKGDYTITLPEKDSTLVVYIKDDSGSLTNLNLSSYTFSVADATSVPNFSLVFRKKTGSLGENTDSRITFIQSQTNIAVYGLDVMKQLLVYTPTGQLCKQKELNGYETSIDLPSIPGVYLVKIVTNKGAVTKKVINP